MVYLQRINYDVLLADMKAVHKQNDDRMPPLPMASQIAIAEQMLAALPDDPHARISMGEYDFIEAGNLRTSLKAFIHGK